MSLRLGLATLLTLTGCQATTNALFGVGTCKLEQLGTTPVETRDRLVFVTVQVNGQPVNLVLDTGADRTLLSRAAVARLHLGADAVNGTRSWGVGGPTASFDALVDSFELAGMALPVTHVAVGDLSVTPLGEGVDGVLGTDVLRWFDVDLDTPHRQMTLYRGEPCWLTAPPWSSPAVALTGVRGLSQGLQVPIHLFVPIEVDGVRGLALVDTGSQASAITQAFATRAGASPAALKADQAVVVGGAGPDPVAVPLHRFHTLRIGAWVEDNPLLPILEAPQDPEADPSIAAVRWQGLVGEDFLYGHRIWFSLAGWQIFISEPAART
jgi:hypothetical protein